MALFPPGKGDLLVDEQGKPLSATATPASGSERAQVNPLLERIRVYHGYNGPKQCPKESHADKGYDSQALRIFLRNKGIKPVIAKRRWKTGKQPPRRKTPASTTRWQVERCFVWMQKKFRRLVTR